MHSSETLWGIGVAVLALGFLLAFRGGGDPVSPPPKTVEIRAVAGLQYDRVRFAVQPEQEVELTLENASSLAHNLVITDEGAREAVVAAANRMGAEGPEREYVPESDDILHFTPVIDPDSSATLAFTAPGEAGVYPYVCTYPGHGVVMYGAMYVSPDGEAAMPPLEEDAHVPPDSLRAGASAAVTSAHPYPTAPPIMYRTFMPNSSPATIAVGLTGGVSYAFDTVPVTIRYAWSGGFVDNSEVFKGHVANQRASIEGTVFYRSEGQFPLRIGDAGGEPSVEFEGYRMIEERPQFRYTMDGITVRELVTPAPDGVGLRREFQIADPPQAIRFVRQAADSLTVKASAGTWQADTLRLSPTEAREFTITMTK
jgi:azurin